MVTLVLLALFLGSLPGVDATAARGLLERAHVQALASTRALAVVTYCQRRRTTTLDDRGQPANAPKDTVVNGTGGLDLSVSTIFDPDRYEYAIDPPDIFRGEPVTVVSFTPLPSASRMLPSAHNDLGNRVMNTVINHLTGKLFIDDASGAIVHFDAHLATSPLGFTLGRVFAADVSCDQMQVGASWFPSTVTATFHYQVRNWHYLFLRTSVVHQHVVATFVY